MATLSEVLRASPVELSLLAGGAGLGRDVRRVVHRPPRSDPGLSGLSVSRADLIVYAAAEAQVRHGHAAGDRGRDGGDRGLSRLVSASVAGVLVDLEPDPSVVQLADSYRTPLLRPQVSLAVPDLLLLLQRAVAIQEARLTVQHGQVQRDLLDLAHAGASAAMLVERLMEITGKAAVLQSPQLHLDAVQAAASQHLAPGLIEHAIESSAGAVQRWLRKMAEAAGASVLYLELPGEGLVRLVAPVWSEGQAQGALSLIARPAELAARDRLALLAAARAVASRPAGLPAEPEAVASRPPTLASRSPTLVSNPPVLTSSPPALAALALRAPSASLQALCAAATRRIDFSRGAVTVGVDDVRGWLPYASPDDWRRCLDDWHTRLSEELGRVSIGHVLRRAAEAGHARRALVQAAEAALVGDRLFGAGHVTSYADAQLAKFLLGEHDPGALRALYERAVGKLAAEDLKRESDLVATLEAYCETFATQRTAERLGVHRNTVLYRLKRIEEITSADIEDGSTRLLFQCALMAGRLLRQAHGARQQVAAAAAGAAGPAGATGAAGAAGPAGPAAARGRSSRLELAR